MHNTRISVICFLLLFPSQTWAGVDVLLNANAPAELESVLGRELSDIEAELSQELERTFKLLEPLKYLSSMSDAHAFSNKGIGADYGSVFDGFIFGVSGNISFKYDGELGESQDDRVPVEGAAPGLALMAGFNLGFMGLDDSFLYLNGFSYSPSFESSQYSNGGLDLTLRNLGAHLQMKFFQPDESDYEFLFKWGGFDITTGFEYSYMSMKLESGMDFPIPVQSSADAPQEIELDILFEGRGDFEIQSTAMTVPLELSTNIRVLYLLTMFMGVGVDLQLGEATTQIDMEADLSTERPDTGERIELGTATVRADEKGKPSEHRVRFFGGLQANWWILKTFVQANFAEGAVGMTFGLRGAW